jgi:hypothetical protein
LLSDEPERQPDLLMVIESIFYVKPPRTYFLRVIVETEPIS